MRLIPGARDVALKSWSLWANRAGFASLLYPLVSVNLTGAGPDPVLIGWAGVVLYVAAELLRYLDQGGLDGRRDTFFSPVWLVALALVLTMGMGRTIEEPAPPPVIGPPSDAAVLAVAVPLVAKWEGLRTEAYLDPVGVWTICFGETADVQPGDTRTEAECHAGLRRLLPDYGHAWYRYLTEDTLQTRLPPARAAAFWSFAYNVGKAGAGRSTATKRLNAGNIRGACEAMTWWNKGGGRVLRGLVNRRTEESTLCLQGLT